MSKQTEALKLALEALEEIALAGMSPAPEMIDSKEAFHARQAWRFIGIAARQLTAIREALAEESSGTEQPAQQQEPVAVKNMMRWVDSLKRLSDNGQHMKIPSELSAGTCWELAIELEQFITSPPRKPWVGLTEFDIDQIPYGCSHADSRLIAYTIEAKLREKNA